LCGEVPGFVGLIRDNDAFFRAYHNTQGTAFAPFGINYYFASHKAQNSNTVEHFCKGKRRPSTVYCCGELRKAVYHPEKQPKFTIVIPDSVVGVDRYVSNRLFDIFFFLSMPLFAIEIVQQNRRIGQSGTFPYRAWT